MSVLPCLAQRHSKIGRRHWSSNPWLSVGSDLRLLYKYGNTETGLLSKRRSDPTVYNWGWGPSHFTWVLGTPQQSPAMMVVMSPSSVLISPSPAAADLYKQSAAAASTITIDGGGEKRCCKWADIAPENEPTPALTRGNRISGFSASLRRLCP